MFVDSPITFSLQNARAELLPNDLEDVDQQAVLVVEATDKLFVGGGCEAITGPMPKTASGQNQGTIRHNGQAYRNISVCVHSPHG